MLFDSKGPVSNSYEAESRQTSFSSLLKMRRERKRQNTFSANSRSAFTRKLVVLDWGTGGAGGNESNLAILGLPASLKHVLNAE